MAAREHSRFVHFVLPWLAAAAGLLLYGATLNRWVGFSSVEVVSKVAGWDWNSMQLGPVTLLVTYPLRLLPAPLQPVGLNAFSALLAALVLGLLVKCIVLLPHDRTREQRQRERSDFSFLTIPFAWMPAAAAAALLGFQLTFWENATAMTGEMVNLALFAFCIFSFLRFRILEEDRYLAWLSFAFGAAAANDWGVIGFAPLFFCAIVWAKGIPFFDGPFLIRTTLAGIAGLLFYLVQPIALKMSGQSDMSFFELLRTQLSFQRQYIFSFPRTILLFCSLTSIVPVVFMGIRWPSSFGDMSAAGSAITNVMFRVVHLVFLAACTWVMFDPPFSPREIGLGLPFLHFYFLAALVVGYMSGYAMLVFSQEPDRKAPRPPGSSLIALGKLVAGLSVILPIAAAGMLAVRSAPTIQAQNGPFVRELAETLVDLPPGKKTLVSDDNSLLMLAMGLLTEKGQAKEVIPISDPIGDNIILHQMVALGLTNQLYYLHPSFGFYFESYYLRPTNTVYAFNFQTMETFRLPQLPDEEFNAVHQRWNKIREKLVENPTLARMRERKMNDTIPIAAHYSRALNTWGVALQRRGRSTEAADFFTAASQLSKDNIAAIINTRYNENLRSKKNEAVVLEKALNDQLGRYRDLPSFLSICGPVDEPLFCYRLGRILEEGGLHRQAAQQFARALDLQPDSLEYRFWLASASLSAQTYDETLKVLGEIRSDKRPLTVPQQTDLATIEAWARYRKGDLPTAERILAEAQAKFPDRMEPIQTLGDIYVAANQTNAALQTIDKLIERLPGDPRPLISKSAILMQTGALAEAVRTLNTVLEKDPGFFPALVNRALALFQMGRLEESEKDYRRLLELAPKLNMVYYHLGEIDFQRRKGPEARKHYQKFIDTAVPGSPEARTAEKRIKDIAAGKFGA
jgi:tetratricopeptide (TPR) repeat protein